MLRSTPDGTRDRLFKDTDGLWKVERNCAYISSYNGESITTSYYSNTGELSTGASVVYALEVPTYETLPDSIQAELNALTTYNPVTNVMVSDGVTPDIDVSFWTRDYYAKNAADNAAKVATNFINYDSTNGLVLGNKESGSWVGYRTQIDNDSFNVLDANGDIIASYGSNEVELGKGNPNAIIKMCDGKAYVKNYIVGSQNTSVFCGQDVTVVGEWEGASESYALFKQGFASIGQSSSYIRFSNETDNMNQVEIQGQNITMRRVTNVGDFNCYMDANFKGSVTIATPLSIADGGTGAKTAAGARNNLGVKSYQTRVITSASYTVSANTYKVVSFTLPTISGYTPIGIVQIKNGTYELALVNFDIVDSTKARVVIRNISSASKTFTLTIHVLYEES